MNNDDLCFALTWTTQLNNYEEPTRNAYKHSLLPLSKNKFDEKSQSQFSQKGFNEI